MIGWKCRDYEIIQLIKCIRMVGARYNGANRGITRFKEAALTTFLLLFKER